MMKISSLNKITCPDCGAYISLHDRFGTCMCGTLPINIIFYKFKRHNPLLAEKLYKLTNGKSLSNSLQIKAWNYMKRANSRFLQSVHYEKIIYINDNDKPKSIGLGNFDTIKASLTSNSVYCYGNDFIVPNIVANNYISGFWIYSSFGELQHYYELFPGGMCYTFTLDEGINLDNNIYLFDDPLEAVLWINTIKRDTSKYPPIISHPYLDIQNNYQWLPNLNIALFVNGIYPEKFKHLIKYGPSVVDTKSFRLRSKSVVLLRRATAKAVPIKSLCKEYVAISPTRGVYVTNGKWYLHPSDGLAMNGDIVISKKKVHKGRSIYKGQLVLDDTTIPFICKQKKNAYDILTSKCNKQKVQFYCTPCIRKHLIDIAEINSTAKTIKINKFGWYKEKFLFPHVDISTSGIKENIKPYTSSTPGIPFKIKYYHNFKTNQLHKYLKYESTINQLAIAVSIAFTAITNTHKHKSKNKYNDLFIYNAPPSGLSILLPRLGIPVKTKGIWKHNWPVYLSSPSIELLSAQTNPILITGSEFDLIVFSLVSSFNICFCSDNFTPLISRPLLSGLMQTLLYEGLKYWKGLPVSPQFGPLANYKKLLKYLISLLALPDSISTDLSTKIGWETYRKHQAQALRALIIYLYKHNLLTYYKIEKRNYSFKVRDVVKALDLLNLPEFIYDKVIYKNMLNKEYINISSVLFDPQEVRALPLLNNLFSK